MSLPPVTEDDRPAIEATILRLKRLRKREAENASHNWGQPNLDDAITALMEYGALKGWWEYE